MKVIKKDARDFNSLLESEKITTEKALHQLLAFNSTCLNIPLLFIRIFTDHSRFLFSWTSCRNIAACSSRMIVAAQNDVFFCEYISDKRFIFISSGLLKVVNVNIDQMWTFSFKWFVNFFRRSCKVYYLLLYCIFDSICLHHYEKLEVLSFNSDSKL